MNQNGFGERLTFKGQTYVYYSITLARLKAMRFPPPFCFLFLPAPALPPVFQDDALYPLLTVRETLQFAAELRIPNLSKVRCHYCCWCDNVEIKHSKTVGGMDVHTLYVVTFIAFICIYHRLPFSCL